ncbi:MAG: alpha/beta fold hydrolase [Desulfosarcina sp.]|nr:alpha/beta fold hydrolase [Desulfobacterales bacterium]
MASPSPHSTFEQQKLTFVCDGLLIASILHLPSTRKPPVVIGSHGLFSSGDSPKQIALAEELNASGIAFLRLDHRGCGQSEGQFEAVTTLDGRVRDLIEAARVLAARLGPPLRLGLFGSSLGGTTCLAAAPFLKPERMVTLAAPIDSRSLLTAARQNPASPLPPLFETASFQFDLADKLAGLHDLLVIHGERDEVVPVDHARRIHAASREPKQLIINPGGDHRVTNPEHQRIFIEICRHWFKELLNIQKSEPSSC